MPPKAPKFIPTIGLAVVWIALYFLWVAVRPEAVVETTTRQPGASGSTTTTTVPSLFKFKP